MVETKAETLAKLEQVFQDIFDDPSMTINDAMTREDFPNWDSLGHIRLVSATEEAFDVSFTIEEIEDMTSVSRILAKILGKT